MVQFLITVEELKDGEVGVKWQATSTNATQNELSHAMVIQPHLATALEKVSNSFAQVPGNEIVTNKTNPSLSYEQAVDKSKDGSLWKQGGSTTNQRN